MTYAIRSILAASGLALLLGAPVAAQEATTQVYEQVEAEMNRLGMDTSQLSSLSAEQLAELDAILTDSEDSDQDKMSMIQTKIDEWM